MDVYHIMIITKVSRKRILFDRILDLFLHHPDGGQNRPLTQRTRLVLGAYQNRHRRVPVIASDA